MGWVRVAIIESSGTTSLQLDGSNHYILTGSLTATLRFGGGPVTAGQFGAWTPIGAEQSGQNGFRGRLEEYRPQPVRHLDCRRQRQLPFAKCLLSPTSFAFESLETPFGQDLNGDGTTGLTTAPIEAAGSTTLTQVADSYFINYGSSPVQLRYGGMYVAAGQFGAWVPIGAEQAGNAYQVAWRNGAADQYLAWNVDLDGNYLSQGGVVSGASWYAEIVRILRHAPGSQR